MTDYESMDEAEPVALKSAPLPIANSAQRPFAQPGTVYIKQKFHPGD